MKKRLKTRLAIIMAAALMGVFVGGCGSSTQETADTFEEENQEESLDESMEENVDDGEEATEEEMAEDDSEMPDPNDLEAVYSYFEENDYTVTWPVLWVVATDIDADGTMDGTPVHGTVQMPEEEQDFYMNEMMVLFEQTVEEATGGFVDVDITSMLYTDPITYLDEEENCLTPESFSEEARAEFANYNSVICTARFCEPDEPIFSQDWIGMALGVIPEGGYGFCQVASNYEYDDTTFRTREGNPIAAEPWIHEWIHTMEQWGEVFEITIPDPDSAEDHGYECAAEPGDINGFYQYYFDTLNGEVPDEATGENVGFTEALWKSMAYMYDGLREE